VNEIKNVVSIHTGKKFAVENLGASIFPEIESATSYRLRARDVYIATCLSGNRSRDGL
jgi:hypothetical protein